MLVRTIFQLVTLLLIDPRVFSKSSTNNLDDILNILDQQSTLNLKTTFIGPLFHLEKNNTYDYFFKCKDLFYTASHKYKIGRHHGLRSTHWPPIRNIPQSLMNSFTIDGRIELRSFYLEEKQNGGSGYHWTKSDINYWGKQVSTCGYYELPQCQHAVDKYKDLYIKGKNGMVVGTQTPWAEALLLEAGAAHVTTLEYMNITSDDDRLSGVHPNELERVFLSGEFKPLDFIFSFSSLEHDGLGRYGDPINPFADLEMMAKAYCMLKDDGLFFFAVPVGGDAVIFNSARIYGKTRLSLLFKHWIPIDVMGDMNDIAGPVTGDFSKQPIWVLKKKTLHIHHQSNDVLTYPDDQ